MQQRLANNLRYYRQLRELTQEEIATRLNIQRQSYCNYEKGRRIPDICMLTNISDILGVRIDDLLREDHSEKE